MKTNSEKNNNLMKKIFQWHKKNCMRKRANSKSTLTS